MLSKSTVARAKRMIEQCPFLSDLEIGRRSGMSKWAVSRLRERVAGERTVRGGEVIFTAEELERLDRWLIEHGV